jgi:valyl-tRNA synthetase
MASTQGSEKPMSEKQRLKLEKFAKKKEKQAQQAQQQGQSGLSKKQKAKKPDFHKAYIPRVVESAWYSFWEVQGLFKPQTEADGNLKPKGKYVIAIPPPNVRTHVSKALPSTNNHHR